MNGEEALQLIMARLHVDGEIKFDSAERFHKIRNSIKPFILKLEEDAKLAGSSSVADNGGLHGSSPEEVRGDSQIQPRNERESDRLKNGGLASGDGEHVRRLGEIEWGD